MVSKWYHPPWHVLSLFCCWVPNKIWSSIVRVSTDSFHLHKFKPSKSLCLPSGSGAPSPCLLVHLHLLLLHHHCDYPLLWPTLTATFPVIDSTILPSSSGPRSLFTWNRCASTSCSISPKATNQPSHHSWPLFSLRISSCTSASKYMTLFLMVFFHRQPPSAHLWPSSGSLSLISSHLCFMEFILYFLLLLRVYL